MAVSLKKGQKISLSKDNAGLKKVIVGLGWDEVKQKRGLFGKKPQDIDCDASALVLTNGKLAHRNDIVFFGGLRHISGAVVHQGDNLTGAGEGDDEQIVVDLAALPSQYDRIVFVVNIYQAQQRGQTFDMIQNAFIRIVDASNSTELARYDLSENYPGMTAMIFGEIYRKDGEWKFGAIGQGTTDDSITALAAKYE